MTVKRYREGPPCWCGRPPCPTSYVKHNLALAPAAGYQVTSSVWRCPRCGFLIAVPEKWDKL